MATTIEEIENKTGLKKVTISNRPVSVDIEGLSFEMNGCFINSYRVAKENRSVQIVEGIAIYRLENGASAMTHVWNKKGDLHFDITKQKIWAKDERSKEVLEVLYFPIETFNHQKYENGDTFKFSKRTEELLTQFKKLLDIMD